MLTMALVVGGAIGFILSLFHFLEFASVFLLNSLLFFSRMEESFFLGKT